MSKRELRIDPRDFIQSPFVACPQCRQTDLGTLIIGNGTWTKRCRNCWYTTQEVLPPIQKKIIYLDQFAISNLMKLESDDQRGRVEWHPFWSRLDTLTRRLEFLQLAIFPDSQDHKRESVLSQHYERLRSTYERLSQGITFDFADQVRNKQIADLTTTWLEQGVPSFSFDPSQVIAGGGRELHSWSEHFYITTRGEVGDFVGEVRTSRQQDAAAMSFLFDEWRKYPLVFADAFENEIRGWFQMIAERAMKSAQARTSMSVDALKADPFAFLPSEDEHKVAILEHILRTHTGDEREYLEKAREFAHADVCRALPFLRISSCLFAAIRHRIGSGYQKKPSDQGMMTDIQVVSTLAPYCDAMLVDNTCRSLWDEVPRAHRDEFPIRLYSISTAESFFAYLQAIVDAATPEHLALVHRLYGDEPDWEARRRATLREPS